MDDKSLEILEFFEVREILARYTSFPVSRELALNLKPVVDYSQVSLWLRQSAEARHLLERGSLDIGGASDIREKVKMAALGSIIEPMGLIDIQRTLATMRYMRSSLSEVSAEAPLLWDICKDIVELPDLEKQIIHCFSPSGEILDRASTKLAGIRAQLREVRQSLRERLDEIIRTPKGQKIVQDSIITEREGRFVIPVRAEYRKDIEGITHDVSNTGATLFVEPWATVEMGNNVRELVSAEKREIERILRELSSTVGTYESELLESIQRLAELDLALAKARYAREVKGSEPKLINPSEDGSRASIKLVNARHPLIGPGAVPLSVEIGRDFSILVITGPNTGGKTVALKTVGLLSLMTQSGMPIPAAPETQIPILDNVFADIGDEQSIEQTLSSFSWHMGNIVRIINNATERSLVLLDELGTSTDPAEGSALARSILLHFLASGTLIVSTTHYSDLKAFAHTTPGLQNASFDFDPATLLPTYHMTLGIPGGSNALATAARLGVPGKIINEARAMLSKGALDLDAALADVMAEKQKIEAARELLEKEKDDAEVRRIELEGRLAELKIKEQKVVQEARDKIVREAAELHKQIRLVSSELRKKKNVETVTKAKKMLAETHTKLKTESWTPQSLETEITQNISVGDTVYLRDINLRGTVLSIYEPAREVEVQAGQIKLRVSMDSMDKIIGEIVPQPATPYIKIPSPKAVPSEIDLRGKRADEVEVALDSYLSDATLANRNEVLIIHGIATGTVRQIVRDFLAASPLVKSFRPGKSNEGGDGVTVVSL
ncbi:MAG: endonuclease MutS2 [Chloroflexota bacterium]